MICLFLNQIESARWNELVSFFIIVGSVFVLQAKGKCTTDHIRWELLSLAPTSHLPPPSLVPAQPFPYALEPIIHCPYPLSTLPLALVPSLTTPTPPLPPVSYPILPASAPYPLSLPSPLPPSQPCYPSTRNNTVLQNCVIRFPPSAAGPWLKYRGHLDNISNNMFIGWVIISVNSSFMEKQFCLYTYNPLACVMYVPLAGGRGAVILVLALTAKLVVSCRVPNNLVSFREIKLNIAIKKEFQLVLSRIHLRLRNCI